ncbi:NADPH-dependent 2,4-dienoyl-CoA reductase, sulfur reductase [Pseudosulfitobacter pseudonitzschiae]|uniref:(2Fe-2S)-binding protein n=1 Tax=Pseudosulfitobacter pseudonitzschiae TaxID=1402135 RepID=A0A073J6B7_9RHOB|nr:NAD(P)/FAD-dependent oxidoreductase [Pseudosulfitobacter pseudonitzschiae]KEJ97256.1 (2Fe-2S)-binding protein [Pseudosulfitobacter pseudonitzschiae]QKS10331.1 FAD-dependent oxidoreductase [Pseudosulfitobacter pseudonitzschiae]SHF55275.1 NADPH-dependent 2,4-dienoyl-CoA reductase, sulfur reductase [Pseudosulfitobacter pseudonitzschiae]
MTRVLIVGAGPAGIRAAQRLVTAGLHPVVVDEGARAGGQIYRRPPEGFTRPPQTLYGSEADKALELHRCFDRMLDAGQLTYHPRSSVLALGAQGAQVLGPDGVDTLAYDKLILATGATDRLAPVPGWQSAGVYSLGATQIALKSQGVALGRRMVLAGSGPLLTLVASQLRKAGAQVVAVLDTAPLTTQAAGAFGMALARPRVTLRGAALRAGLGRSYHAGVTLTRIAMNSTGPVAIHWQDARGRDHMTPCDMVGLGWHLRAETHLADLAGVSMAWDKVFHQWLPLTDAMGRAAAGVYLAGDGMRILGADGAELAGKIAASACLQDLGVPAPDTERDLKELRRMQRFASAMQRAFPWPAQMVRDLPADTVLCRCEAISVGDLRTTLSLSGPEANRAKSLSRVGMGRCQGRYCQLAGAEVLAAEAGVPVDKIGRLRSQPPVRPAPISAYLDKGPDARAK